MSFSAVVAAVKRNSIGVLVMLTLPVAAQQPIQFSKPANSDPTVTANAFMRTSHKSPDAFNAPTSLFGNRPTASFDILPGSPPPIILNPNAAQQWQKALEERKNWGLLTPAQIMGVPTPESILGITDPQNDPKLTPEERYLKRRDQEARAGFTNSMLQANAMLWRNDDRSKSVFDNSQDGQNFGFMAGQERDVTQNPAMRNMTESRGPFFNPSPRSAADVHQRIVDTTWISAFQSPEPLPKPTPEQLAGMERFKALFDPTPAATTPSAFATPATPPAPAPDPFMERPAPFNPAGYAPAALQSGISRPTGLTPLSGITGPRPAPAKPAPLVQTPPWMSGPQIGTMPQRQF